MHRLAARVLRTLRRRGLAGRGDRVLVALSGGSDSVALAHLLNELAAAGEATLAGIAHLHHGLRGADADADETFCRALAARLDLPFDAARTDVRDLARREHVSIEAAARRARYGFLEQAAVRLGADRIAVGHTRDDQAETFLLRLLRGAGTRGLAAIRPRAGRVVRPLIDLRRAALQAYLAERGLEFREDPTNRDIAIPRNRIRRELLPYLGRHFSGAIVEVLAREAELAREDGAWLDEEAAARAPAVVRLDAEPVTLHVAALLALPPALGRRVARLALAAVSQGRFVGSDHVAALLELAAYGTPGGRLDLPGQRATRTTGAIALAHRRRGTPPHVPPRVPLGVPGEATLEACGWTVAAASAAWDRSAGGPTALSGRGGRTVIDAAEIRSPLAVRTRRPGDRFRPLGLGGRKKLQDFFVDRKIPRDERDSVPLVVDADDRIVWVAGQAVADEFRVTAGTRAVIILTARRLD